MNRFSGIVAALLSLCLHVPANAAETPLSKRVQTQLEGHAAGIRASGWCGRTQIRIPASRRMLQDSDGRAIPESSSLEGLCRLFLRLGEADDEQIRQVNLSPELFRHFGVPVQGESMKGWQLFLPAEEDRPAMAMVVRPRKDGKRTDVVVIEQVPDTDGGFYYYLASQTGRLEKATYTTPGAPWQDQSIRRIQSRYDRLIGQVRRWERDRMREWTD